MNAAQDAKYDKYVGQIEAALDSTRMADKAKILGLLARMALVAIHPDLDEGYDWKTAASSDVDPHSPKIDAMTKRVLTNRTCGHIVFVDNIAAHRWVVQTLVQAGIPEGRIAVLDAEVAQAAADRQRIARVQRRARRGDRPEVRRRDRQRHRLRGHRPPDAHLRDPPPRPALGTCHPPAAQRARRSAGQHPREHRDQLLLRPPVAGRAPVQPRSRGSWAG